MVLIVLNVTMPIGKKTTKSKDSSPDVSFEFGEEMLRILLLGEAVEVECDHMKYSFKLDDELIALLVQSELH